MSGEQLQVLVEEAVTGVEVDAQLELCVTLLRPDWLLVALVFGISGATCRGGATTLLGRLRRCLGVHALLDLGLGSSVPEHGTTSTRNKRFSSPCQPAMSCWPPSMS